MPRRSRLTWRIVLAMNAALLGCVTIWQNRFHAPADAAQVDRSAPFLKAHLANGDVVVLTQWMFKTDEQVSGNGIHYDAERQPIRKGKLDVSLSEVSLFETNEPHSVVRGDYVVLGVAAAVTAGVGIACAASPKSCFGSCPTFYADIDGRPRLLAEGFSASVAPSLEATDVDALGDLHARGEPIVLTMVNEALETHSVRSIRLLAVRQPAGGRVFRAGEHYYQAPVVHEATRCVSPEGDCLGAIRAPDDVEYRSPASADDLAAKEEVLVEFPQSAGKRLGVVVQARNTLLNTFVFYQALAFMGTRTADWWMALEHGGPDAQKRYSALGELLGQIEVDVLAVGSRWRSIGAYAEVGPIAKDTQLVVLPEGLGPGPVQVRLRLTRGNWKVDWVALAELGDEVPARAVPLVLVEKDGVEDARALELLRSGASHLVTLPGDRYTLRFAEVPGGDELFLESRGYYTEWMREEWLKDEDPDRVAELFLAPDQALRRMAPAYKQLEQRMEEVFWRSKVGR
jgi:hypothetical protein